MKLDNEFEVPRSVDETWAVLTDLERIAPCMPGAQLTEVEGDTYHGTVKVKVGPMVAQYAGQARFKEKDDAAHRAILEAKGKERTGKGLASALVTASLTGQGDNSTKVVVSTDLTISGPLAQFGRGAIAEVSSKLLGQFSENLRAMLESGSSSGDTPSSNGSGSAAAAASATGTPAPASPTASHVNGAPSIGTPADIKPVPSTSSSAATASAAASSGTATSGAAAPGTSGPAGPADSTQAAAAPSPTAPAPSSATSGTSTPPSTVADAASSRRVVQSKEAEPVDLMSVAGSSILKRVIPLVIVLAIIIALIIWLVLS
jgi:carbon monoxide dehydrogenase subunit G